MEIEQLKLASGNKNACKRYYERNANAAKRRVLLNEISRFGRISKKETLEKLLMQKDKIIISIGGGTPCYFENMQYILNSSSNVFFINATVSTLANRLFYEKDSRPLIKSINDINKLEEFISKHLFERMFYYRKSNHIIDGNDNDVENICNHILKKLI